MFKCPECDRWVIYDDVDQFGQCWHCPNCGAKDSDYSTIATNHTEVDKNAKIIYSMQT